MRFLILIILWLFTVEGRAMSNMYFKHYNNKQGLSHNTVFCSLQDKQGFLWFGTDEGLNRFDGHTFKVYRNNPLDKNTIPSDKIRAIKEDANGLLWICTSNGLCCYDYKTDLFYPKDIAGNLGYYALDVDKDQNLWLVKGEHLTQYNLQTDKTVLFPCETYFQANYVKAGDNGAVWVLSHDAAHQYNKESNNFINYTILDEDEKQKGISLTCCFPIDDQYLLIGTTKSGVKLLSIADSSINVLIPSIRVRDIQKHTDNNYWIASESGIHIYNSQTDEITHLQKSLTNNYTISDNAVYTLTADQEGGMWVGSFFGGVNYLPKEYVQFNVFIGGKTHPELLGNAIREIVPDNFGNLWLGTEDNGINKYNLSTKNITNYSTKNKVNPLSATNVHGLYVDGNDLWIGTFDKGIEIMDIPTGKIVKRFAPNDKSHGLASDFILCFIKKDEHEIYVGTSSGLFIYDKRTDHFTRWNNSYTSITQLYKDSQENIWVATLDGLYCITIDSLLTYRHDPNNPHTIGDNSINSVFEDSLKTIWVTTVNGLYRLDKQKNEFKAYTIKNGFPSNRIYRIEEDSNSNLWISTANGLVRFNPKTEEIRTYAYSDGLHEIQFNYSSSYKSKEGTIYMGTINGMISFEPNKFKTDLFTPAVHLTDLELLHADKDKKNLLVSSPIDELQEIVLPYNLSSFTLSYVALTYTSPNSIHYAYKLEPADKSWVNMDQKHQVTFSNLPFGEYVFKVKSTNSAGAWTENIKSLKIIITPPLWTTWWAKAFYLLLFGLIIYFIYLYKRKKLIEKQLFENELFEVSKEKELYDAKIQFFTHITHEIRTPLTLIKSPLEKIIKSGDGSVETKENLALIDKNSNRLLMLSNQLLDFKDITKKGVTINKTDTDIKQLLSDITDQFKAIIFDIDPSFAISLPQQAVCASIDKEVFTKIVSNILSNATKFAEHHLELHLSIQGEQLLLSVMNDGRLIDMQQSEKIFEPFYRIKETQNIAGSGIGLPLARSLATLHGGSLLYSQTADGLNQFTLSLPIGESPVCLEEETVICDLSSSPKIAAPESDRKYTLLVVEDQQDMREYICKELSETYNVYAASNGKEALVLLEKVLPHAIISDVMMPIMDGYTLCKEIKNNIIFSHIPVVLLTAQHQLASHLEGLQQGADAYLEKPFSLELLFAQIRNLIQGREALHQAYAEKPFTTYSTLASTTTDSLFIKKMHDYIDENIMNDSLSIESLAEAMSMSTSSLYRKVKGVSGLSPIDLVKIARLKKAVFYIHSGETCINEIAYKAGFSSSSYFSTCFQKQYKMSPSDFIKNERANCVK